MSRPESVAQNDVLAGDFADFIAALNAHEVEYVLVGGYAVAVHGVIRATGDMDIFHRRTVENVQKLMAAMRDFGAPEACIDAAALMNPAAMTYFGSEPFRIDLLNSISGVTFDQVWPNVLEIQSGGERIRVIGIKELLANKQASGRPKDKQDVKELAKRTAAPEEAPKAIRNARRKTAGGTARGPKQAPRKAPKPTRTAGATPAKPATKPTKRGTKRRTSIRKTDE